MSRRPPLTVEQIAIRERMREEARIRNAKRIAHYNPLMAARNALRREFSRSPIVIDMMNDPATKRKVPQFKRNGERHAVDATEHLCSKCDTWSRSTKYTKFAIDHIDPVVDPHAGFIDLLVFYKRMFVGREKLQKICGRCHNTKTTAERQVREVTDDWKILIQLETADLPQDALVRAVKKRFTKKRLEKYSYPPEFITRLEALRLKLL